MDIIVAGDYAPCGILSNRLDNQDYSFFSEVKPVLDGVDYSIVNLECPIVSGTARPINKVGPNLCCSERGVEALKWAGFNCVSLANNHFFDYGDSGVKTTIDACKRNGIEWVGGGVTLADASKILYKRVSNETLAIINCCEHEFSIATDQHGGSNPLNSVRLYYDVKTAKKNADYVIVIIHGGHEHFQLPSPRMVELYHFLIDVGADSVINHHQHCFSGYELYNGRPIFYGLGNFCFDIDGIQRRSLSCEGYMAHLVFSKEEVSFSIIPYLQCSDEYIGVQVIENGAFDQRIEKLNHIIDNPSELSDFVKEYYNSITDDLRVMLSPINNRYIRAILYRKIIPVVLSKKYLLRLEDFFLCESHRDKMEFFFCKNND